MTSRVLSIENITYMSGSSVILSTEKCMLIPASLKLPWVKENFIIK